MPWRSSACACYGATLTPCPHARRVSPSIEPSHHNARGAYTLGLLGVLLCGWVGMERAADGTTVVTVIESSVAVKGEGTEGVKVAAGQRSVLDHGRAQPPQALGNTDPDAWTRGLLKVNDQPLSDVLQTLASDRHGLVRFDTQALQHLRVSGVFKLDDTAAAFAALADNLPIQVEYFTDLLVVVKPR
ncbi:transmembrane sensor [Pseudomonas antarctica]|uniref:Fec operon regulator FecR n=1 Tax=Pseudomonas antarctica TaxID=219572 RepID=A0A1H0BR15_9PSED|nr:fec operon regulator FecR [Pseudomonas antarctica]SDN48032.1 transmembrane sensor [Pseudomonas antarctica]